MCELVTRTRHTPRTHELSHLKKKYAHLVSSSVLVLPWILHRWQVHSILPAWTHFPGPGPTVDSWPLSLMIALSRQMMMFKVWVGGGAGFSGVCGFPRPGVCSGHNPVLSGFRQSQPAVPRRAPTCLSPFT